MIAAFIYMGLIMILGCGLHAAAYFLRCRQSDKVRPPSVSGRVVMYGIFALVGLAFGLFGWNIAISADDDAADWSKTDGTVTVFEEVDEAVIYDRGFSFSGNVTDPLYPVLLNYEYAVDGTTYIGDKILADERLNAGLHEFEEAELKDYRQKYASGSAVRVLYNPDDPADAALETTDNTGLLALGVGTGVLFGLVAGVFSFPIGQYVMTRSEMEANDGSMDKE